MDYALLEFLRARSGEWCSAHILADELSADPSRIQPVIDELKAGGYIIEHQPQRGYRLAGTQDRLLEYELTRDLGTKTIGSKVVVVERVASTNEVGWSEAARGCPDGTAVFAEYQTEGRGRFGRSWFCPPRKGLLLSIVLRPGRASMDSGLLTIVGAVACARAIQEELHLPALIRWPNDVITRRRKVGGVLAESRGSAAGERDFVLGLGLNVNTREAEWLAELRDSASSLALELGRRVDRIQVARAVLRSLDGWYEQLRDGNQEAIADEWRQLSSTLGGRVTLLEDSAEYSGTVLDISLEKGLIVRLDRGGTRIFSAGSTTLLPGAPS